jgi:hypothetical protein
LRFDAIKSQTQSTFKNLSLPQQLVGCLITGLDRYS